MNHKLKSIAVLTALIGSAAANAIADETSDSQSSVGEAVTGAFETDWSKDFSVSFGMKLWINDWNSWGTTILPDGSDAITSVTSNEAVVPMPVVSVKWKDFFVSGSYFSNTDYNFPSFGANADQSNYQWDANVGYYVIPAYLALTAGYKSVNQKAFGDDYEISGPTLGFAGAVPMKWGFSLYTNFAYGFVENRSEAFERFGLSNRNAAYWLIEGGVAYTYNLKELPVDVLLNSATLLAGYRHQQIETEGISSGSADNDTANDIMRGMVVGVNFAW